MEDFKGMHGFTADDHTEPDDFDKNAFWRAITGLNESFQANRAKTSMIRNPVLRMIQKACVGHPFARSQQGSVQRDELFLLWSLLHKRPINLAHYMIKHLERASKKDKGTLCCGGVIGSIALHLGVYTEDLVRDIGESLMDLNYLRRTGFITVDRRRRAYLCQRDDDHYPLPDVLNTYVNGPDYTINWSMNADSHRACKANNPPVLPWQSYDPSPQYADDNPYVELPDHMVGVKEMDNEEVDDDEEEVPRHDEAGTSNPRRCDRQEREDEDMSSLIDRVARLEVR